MRPSPPPCAVFLFLLPLFPSFHLSFLFSFLSSYPLIFSSLSSHSLLLLSLLLPVSFPHLLPSRLSAVLLDLIQSSPFCLSPVILCILSILAYTCINCIQTQTPCVCHSHSYPILSSLAHNCQSRTTISRSKLYGKAPFFFFCTRPFLLFFVAHRAVGHGAWEWATTPPALHHGRKMVCVDQI